MRPYIRLNSVCLDLPIRGRSIAALFRRPPAKTKGDRIVDRRGGEVCETLKDVSLKICAGEKVGLIGANGAGKSSLLRVLAGIYAPTRGAYEAEGDISTLFTATVGMELNASGRENIFLAGRTLGMSRKQIAEVTDEIIEFAQLGEFIEYPVRLYSAGMKTRLGFAVVTAIRPEIILIDEVFGAGDATFYHRANERLQKIIAGAGIMVLAMHSPAVIKSTCERVIWLDKGQIVFDGPVEEGLDRYTKSF